MTTLLKATQPRLDLLRAVAAGQVWQSTWFPYDDFLHDQETRRTRKVSSRMIQLQRAEWAQPGPATGTRCLWHLTEAGQQILDAAALTKVESS